MRYSSSFLALALGLLATGLLAGCGESKYAMCLSYDRPARHEISPAVKKIAISEFDNTRRNDGDWGAVTSDKVLTQLGAACKQYGRYQLFDRSKLGAIMAERDLKLANVTSEAEMRKLGQQADVDAVVFGKVTASWRDDQLVKTKYDYNLKTNVPVHYTKRSVQVIVNITMTDVAGARTIHTLPFTESWDSEKDPIPGQKVSSWDKFAKAMDDSGARDLPSPDIIINYMLDKAVSQFVADVSPHRVEVVEKLDGGKAKCVEQGNALAASGDTAGAIKLYEQGLAEQPADPGVCFNLGLAYEAKRDFAKSEEFYRKAISLKSNEKYVRCLARVRAEQ